MTVRIPGYHAMGASKAVTDGTEHACLAACEDNPECMAVDFNTKEGSCWVHMRGGEGVCGTLLDSPPVTHYERYPCGECYIKIRQHVIRCIYKHSFKYYTGLHILC